MKACCENNDCENFNTYKKQQSKKNKYLIFIIIGIIIIGTIILSQ